ncbi:MAG: cation:proton antiporter regulatory subunit [Granulosicoccus sp.]
MAGTVIDYISAQVDFPEIDIRQRLTISKGYGVSEIYVPEGSNYVGISITDTKLYENDINVLTLYRGNKVIPNPRADRILEAEDKLLCYGKLEAMRGMVPVKTRRRRRPEAKQLVTDVPTGTNPVVA